MDRKLSRLPIKLIVWTVFCLSGQQVDQNYNRKGGKNKEKPLEKHFLQFTVRKNNFFKLLRKKFFFKLLWKKIGFESFCRTLRQQLRSRNEKIVFCFDNCAAKSEDKFVLIWLKCCPSYRSRKKGTEGKFFEAEAVGRGWEMFPRFPFFYWGNLDNTEIRQGPNLSERRGKHNYWNRILFSFVWLFRKHSPPHSI